MRNEGELEINQAEKDQVPLRHVFLDAGITGLHSDEILEMDLPVRKMPLGMQGPENADLLVKYGNVYYPAKEDRFGAVRVTSHEVWSADGETWSTPEQRESLIEKANKRITRGNQPDN